MAGSAYTGESGEMITEINVTPLVDVVLVLLIVMMITMPTIVSIDMLNEREMSVVLPEAGAAKPLITKPKELVVNVSQEGKFTAHSAPQTEESLERLLMQAATDNPGRASVIIRAHKNSRWQSVVTVMNLCNKAKIKDYRVSTAKAGG